MVALFEQTIPRRLKPTDMVNLPLRSNFPIGRDMAVDWTVAACTLLPVTFLLLSRPKGRNSGGEELGRGRWETVSPQGRQNLYGRLARLPRAAPFKRPNRI
jgi:hypothetical protein